MADGTSYSSDMHLHRLVSKLTCDDETVKDYQDPGNNNLHAAVSLDDIDAFFEEVKKNNVNDANVKGEIPLHIAAKNISPQGRLMLEVLIAEGSNVNACNKWHQTPLHYAAMVNSVENIKTLLKAPHIDVNTTDVNGYNPLQSLICSSNNNSPDNNFDSQVKSDFHEAICILVQSGTNINNQTKYGHSILHMAAVREDNTLLIKLLISKVTKQVDLSLKDKMGENFLHLYATSEVWEKVIEMFDIIAKQSLTSLRELLTEQNDMGRTPWEIMIDTGNTSMEVVELVIRYGVPVGRSDNLGNTVLHRVAGVSFGIDLCDILETLIQNGASVNFPNVYGESTASVLFHESVVEVFLKYGLDCNKPDRWGRSPLVSVMKHRPIPNLLRILIEKGHADVNTRDRFGSTPLHFAAYNNYPEQVEMLLGYGADSNATDNLNDRPIDTVRRHCSYRCNDILKRADETNVTTLYRRNITFEDTLLELSKKITSSSINIYTYFTPDNVQRLIGLPDNLDQFMENLMKTYLNRRPGHSNEIETVVNEINELVNSLCLQIKKYDSRFEMSIFPTGSSAEGTKVGPPDEFDFVLCLDKLKAVTDAVMTKACHETGFVCLKFKDTPVSEEYLPFSDKNGYFLADPFLQYFLQYLRKALNETHLWTSGQLYNTREDKMEVIKGKPVFNFSVYRVGSVYKQLKISIDLVPAVYKRGWWPPNINVANIPLMTEAIRAEGCFLMLQTLSNDFDSKRTAQSTTLKDNISQTCNNDRNDESKQRMLRVSAAPAEICLVKTMPKNFRQAYALAKIVKSKEVCPEIVIDELPIKLYRRQEKFRESKTPQVKPSHVIKSYMLKNCAFHVLRKLKADLQGEHLSLNTIRITSQIYTCLLEFTDKQSFNPYFLPFSDVFEFEIASPGKSEYDLFKLRLKRELSIKLVLGILNQPIPTECLASNIQKRY